MKFGVGFYSWGSVILGSVLALAGYLLWSNDVGTVGTLLLALGAGFGLLGILIMMTDMMLSMSVENVRNVKGKRGGPL